MDGQSNKKKKKKKSTNVGKGYGDGKKSLTRATLNWAISTSGRGFLCNEIVLEERVDPAHVVELEYDGPAGLGDLVEGFLLEDGSWNFGYGSD